jgi:hypothetical protein
MDIAASTALRGCMGRQKSNIGAHRDFDALACSTCMQPRNTMRGLYEAVEVRHAQ